MTQKTRLLELRKKMKAKRPSFRRVESWRYVRVKDPWRKARGIDSRTRIKSKSGVKSPSTGYRTPKKVRGLHPSGYEEIRVNTLDELINLNLNTKIHAIKIAGRLGSKKRMEIIEWSQKRNFKILNIGISQKEMEDFDSMLDSSIDDILDDDDEDDDED